MQLKELFKDKTVFIGSWKDLYSIPYYNLPEICFIGRSNVGKSSLINTLTGINGLAKTSATPGRTQTINLFDYIGKLIITDLPGYGFAKAPQKEIKNWNNFTKIYLSGRVDLRRVFLLIDSRHGIKNIDISMMNLLDDSAVPYQIIFTKIDKNDIKQKSDLTKNFDKLYKEHPAMMKDPLFTSSKDGSGINDLKTQILDII